MRKLGVTSNSLVVQGSFLNYGGDAVLGTAKTNPLILEIKRLMAFGYVFRYDIAFFNFGQTLYAPTAPSASDSRLKRTVRHVRNFFYRRMQRLELQILRWRGCTLVIQYQGSDARQGSALRELYSDSHVNDVEANYYSLASDEHKREQIALITPRCKQVYALNPDLLNVLPPGSRFLPYANVDLEDWIPNFRARQSGNLRVGHAPTHRAIKGTEYVLQAIERLQAMGWPVELVLVEGVTNAQARKTYESIDVLVDQLLVGWYGGIAVELMAMGKPVVAYVREADLIHIPREMAQELPVIQSTPKTLEKVLVKLLELPNANWELLQRRSRSYVEKWHNPMVVAEGILADLAEIECDSTSTEDTSNPP